tara:strand:- start:464 stop:709 length:246 start_codon:yes stop_codon:yes gene_type:complete
MIIATMGSILVGRHPHVFCDAQIEKGRIIPTDMIEFKNQKLQFFRTLNQFLGAIINGYKNSNPTTVHNHVRTRSILYCITI